MPVRLIVRALLATTVASLLSAKTSPLPPLPPVAPTICRSKSEITTSGGMLGPTTTGRPAKAGPRWLAAGPLLSSTRALMKTSPSALTSAAAAWAAVIEPLQLRKISWKSVVAVS